MIKRIIGFEGEVKFDTTKPDGTPRKLMDVTKINKMGWKYSIELKAGITSVFEEYRELNIQSASNIA